jgi:hypothetical protein
LTQLNFARDASANDFAEKIKITAAEFEGLRSEAGVKTEMIKTLTEKIAVLEREFGHSTVEGRRSGFEIWCNRRTTTFTSK